MTQKDRSRPSVTQRLADIGWQRRTPLAAVCLGVLALGVFVALASMQPSEADVAAAGVVAPVAAADLAGSAAVPGVPQTDNADLHCFGSAVLFFDPGLTEEPSPQTITGYMNAGTELSPTTPCSSATGIPYKGGTAMIKGSGELACTAARGTLGNAQGTAEIIWDNGDESTAEWSAISYGALPVVEVKITDGELKGSTVYQEGVPTSITGNCVESPVTSLGASGVATIVREETPETPEVPEPEASN